MSDFIKAYPQASISSLGEGVIVGLALLALILWGSTHKGEISFDLLSKITDESKREKFTELLEDEELMSSARELLEDEHTRAVLIEALQVLAA